jgi:ParB family chromosome partitioning protein
MAFQADSIFWVEVEKIVPNPYQPRREFDQSRLEELAESIRMYGVLQPLTVTRKEIQRDDGAFYTEYELIAGERRLRASRLASISLVPVIIREGEQNEQEKLELAIIENLQREDLNAVDRALAFQQLAESFELSHAQVAKKVGRSREYVSNSIRLLALPSKILDALRASNLSEGHARTLLMLSDKPEEQDTVFREILLKKLSVREVERIARSIATDKVRKRDKNYDPDLIALEKKFTETLGTRVQIQKTDFGGKVTIDYFAPEDLTYMLERMKEDAAAQSAERRPFSPPKELVEDNSKETEELTDATPLSALIAQLQQAEAKTEEHITNIASQPTAAVEEAVPAPQSAPAPSTTTESSNSSSEETKATEEPLSPPYQVESEESDVPASDSAADGIRITITDAPVSFTRPVGSERPVQAPAPSIAESHGTASHEVPAPKPEASISTADPRVVAVAREYTTAMYVASVTPPETTAETTTADEPDAPDTTVSEDDESNLYSVRNFSI